MVVRAGSDSLGRESLREEGIWTQTDTMRTWRQRPGWGIYRPEDSREGQPPPEAGERREGCSLRASEGEAHGPLDRGLLASGAEGEYISGVKAAQGVVLCCGSFTGPT